jgi:hypothetical protein
MTAINYTYKVGDKIEARDPATGYWRPAIVESIASYVGRSGPGYYILWDFGRRREQWESAGGWANERSMRPRGQVKLADVTMLPEA